jgi:tetratricopeptide (TPR) repeat protein
LARANLASAALQVAMLSLRAKRYEEAIDHFERGLELRREVAQEDPKSATSALRVVAALDRIGLAYREWGRHPEAIRFGQQALAEAKRVRNLDPANATAAREYVYALGDLALSYQQAGQKPQACTLARETVTFLKGKKSEAPLDPTKEKMTRLLGACGG